MLKFSELSGVLRSSKCVNVAWTALLSWSSASLIDVRKLVWDGLQQNVIDAAANKRRKWLRACMHADREHFEHLFELVKRLKNYGLKKRSKLCPRKSFTAKCAIFTILKFPKVWHLRKQMRLEIRPPSDGIFTQEYLYQKLLNRTTVKVIVEGWVVYVLVTQCSRPYSNVELW